jgi:deazaflavin-dependent oxidoreductase (nitroreductase family)
LPRVVNVNSPIGRLTAKVAGSPQFAAVAPKVIPHVDRVLNRLTGGRFVLSGALLPSLVLQHTGAKSGLTRETPLATMPEGDLFYVVGSNFGREKHPAWTGNLLANPEATVTFRGRTLPVRATLLSDTQKAEVWPRLTKMWPTYDRYVERSGRNLRVFALEPR